MKGGRHEGRKEQREDGRINQRIHIRILQCKPESRKLCMFAFGHTFCKNMVCMFTAIAFLLICFEY